MRKTPHTAEVREGAPAPSLSRPAGLRRWKVTLSVVCLFLAWLGIEDLRIAWRNPSPQRLSPATPGPVKDWLDVEGVLDLAEAINTSGRVEVEALLVPLVIQAGDRAPIRFLLETRDPKRLEPFKQLHFGQDSEEAKAAFQRANAERLAPRLTVRGLRMDGFAARANANRLRKLALETGLSLAPDVTLLVEGREPSPKRGMLFSAIALAGFLRLAWGLRPRRDGTLAGSSATDLS